MGVPPLTSSTPCRRIRRRCCIRDQFVRPLMTPIDCNHHSEAAGTAWKNRRLCLSAPDNVRAKRTIVGAVEPECKQERETRSDPAIIHPRRGARSDMFPGASPAFPGKQGRLGNAYYYWLTWSLNVGYPINPQADIGIQPRDVRFVPKADIHQKPEPSSLV